MDPPDYDPESAVMLVLESIGEAGSVRVVRKDVRRSGFWLVGVGGPRLSTAIGLVGRINDGHDNFHVRVTLDLGKHPDDVPPECSFRLDFGPNGLEVSEQCKRCT